jgi:hypothetical protein
MKKLFSLWSEGLDPHWLVAWGGRLVVVAGDDVDGSARQPYLGWPGRRTYASNRVLVTVIMQGAVGLEKIRAAAGRERRRRVGRVATVVGRMRALWIRLARSRIWTARITMFNETTGVPLTRNSMGIIVNIRGEILSSPRTVCLLTLMSGPVS